MRKNLLRWLLTAFVLVFASSRASAMMMEGMKESKAKEKGMMESMVDMDMPENVLKMIAMLDLTDEQQREIQTIRFVFAKDVVRKKADIDIASIELQEILVADGVDMQSAEQKIREVASLRADLEIINLKLREQIKGKLSPEQLEKLRKHMRNQRMKYDEAGHATMLEKRKEDRQVKPAEKSVEIDSGAAKNDAHGH